LAVLPMGAGAVEEWVPAKTLAVGGAGRAMPLDNAGITLNPAAMVNIVPRYSAETGYQRFDPTRSDVFQASALDCQTSNLAMGISQTFEWSRPPFDPARDMSWWDIEDEELEHTRRIDRFAWALAYGFAQRRFNIGAALRVYHVQDNLLEDSTPVSIDVGMTWWISPNVALGVTGGNLIKTKLEEEPRTLAAGFGAYVLGGTLWFEADGVVDFDSGDKAQIDLNAGAQVTLFQQFNIRGGFASDRAFAEQYVSWGLGWTVAQFSASYSMRIELGEMERRLNDNKSEGANRLLHAWMISTNF
jgi:hypothetical protein